jgi:hypothetical protein
MIQVSQNLDALAAALAEDIRSIAEELEAEGECDSVVLTRLERVAFILEQLFICRVSGETQTKG